MNTNIRYYTNLSKKWEFGLLFIGLRHKFIDLLLDFKVTHLLPAVIHSLGLITRKIATKTYSALYSRLFSFVFVWVDIGWNPELVFLTVVFFNSTDLAVVIPNSTDKRCLFYSTTL